MYKVEYANQRRTFPSVAVHVAVEVINDITFASTSTKSNQVNPLYPKGRWLPAQVIQRTI